MVNKFSELMHSITLWLMFFLFYGFVSTAMAAPVEVNGECYATDIQAIEAWEERLPVVGTSGQYLLYTINAWTASTAGGSLTVPYTAKLGAGAATAYTAVFPPCDVGAYAIPASYPAAATALQGNGSLDKTRLQDVILSFIQSQNLLILLSACFVFIAGFAIGKNTAMSPIRFGSSN